MLDDAAVFSVLSKCFAPIEQGEWEQLTKNTLWSEFLDGARRIMQGPLGAHVNRTQRMRIEHCPLQEFLSAGEVNELYCPPTFEEKRSFAARHFTGGLPESALPIESLYVGQGRPIGSSPLEARGGGRYLGESARYMRSLVGQLGLSVPEEFSACPDHLALELDVVAVLVRSGMVEDARVFLSERFGWLTAYRMRLLALDEDARFYIGLVDVLLGMCAEQADAAKTA